LQKVHAENFFRENSQKIAKFFDISFSSTFLVFKCFLAMGVQKHYKKRLKKIVSKRISKQSANKIQNRLFLDLFYHVFGRFSVRGVQKHDKKI
jgi:hypothetical protein